MSLYMYLINTMEILNRRYSLVGDHPIFINEQFNWVQKVEEKYDSILEELKSVLNTEDRIPNFQDVLNEDILTKGDNWKTYFLYIYSHSVPKNCNKCPLTSEVLAEIPGMRMAFFSILKPGTHISPHRGPFNGVLRYHLGMIIPKKSEDCYIVVNNETVSWQAGKSIIFDDSYIHEVRNNTNQERVVLFVDFIRPMPLVLTWLNKALFRLAEPFLTEIKDARKYLNSHNL